MSFTDRLQKQPRALIFIEAMLLVGLVGYVDFVTGYEVNVYLFYSIPILAAVWLLGRNAGLWISIFSAAVWSIADVVSRGSELTGEHFWNISVQLFFFLFIVLSGAALKGQRDESRARVALLERFRTLAQISPVGIFRVSTAGSLVYVNQRWRQIAGLEESDGLPPRWTDPFHADDRDRVAAEWARATAGNKTCDFEARFRHADGRTVWVLGQVAPEREAAGGVAGYVGAITDMTELRRLEREVLEISDRERARLGQELHDDLCQTLVAIQYSATAMTRELTTVAPGLLARSGELVEMLKSAVVDARQMARRIFPVNLDQASLMSALLELTERSSRYFGIVCRFDCPVPVLIEENSTGSHLFRIAQEALSNAVRHGHATGITISLVAEPPYLTLTVLDNGVGLQPSAGEPAGIGMHIMKYRAQMIGATLAIEPRPEGGTLVRCILRQGGSRLRSLVDASNHHHSVHAA
ncbi:MAG TPA: PAS domain S-box protein [Chthoniobacteraceae bacterium]|jgi:PAS domain S-box-containing protein|nr:PAS domain S-box protein [Chthoniobacteraceae bacterium]